MLYTPSAAVRICFRGLVVILRMPHLLQCRHNNETQGLPGFIPAFSLQSILQCGQVENSAASLLEECQSKLHT